MVTSTASFTIPADQCHLLPAGVSVSGSGESVAIINTHTLADGSTVVRINNLIKGVAIDSNGDEHKFVYHNSSTQTILHTAFRILELPPGYWEPSENAVYHGKCLTFPKIP